MSATNSTQTIGLSQYISTDKPTYLVDYNGDMLKIDNAIASDRDGITTAQNKANTADGKADANKTSIDTINAQLNGDPEVPGNTGLAGDVARLESDVDTIQSLIGNGSPTTSNQTIIGAVNGLEGAIAPREDGEDLANSYAVGEQFARGGSVYTALVPLTVGTAFASLTLNTDYKNSDTLVEQIADANSALADLKEDLPSAMFVVQSAVPNVVVTADGVKTWSDLLIELHTAINTAISNTATGRALIAGLVVGSDFDFAPLRQFVTRTSLGTERYIGQRYDSGNIVIGHIRLNPTAPHFVTVELLAAGNTVTDMLSVVPTSGTTITAYIDVVAYKEIN